MNEDLILNWLNDNKYHLQLLIKPITNDYLEELHHNSFHKEIIEQQYYQLINELVAIEAGKALALSPMDLLEYLEGINIIDYLEN